MIRHIENPGIVRSVSSGTFKYIQEGSNIFSHVETYWGTLRHTEVYSEIIDAHWPIFRDIHNPWIQKRDIFRTLAHLEPDALSKASRTCKMIRHTQSLDIVGTVYSSIFKEILGYIDGNSATHGRATRSEEGDLRFFFLEKQKKCPGFGKKAQIVHIFGLCLPLKI